MSAVNKPIRIFVGSSKESIEVARAVQAVIDRFGGAHVTVWDQQVFEPSLNTVQSLDAFLRDETDLAIMVYTPDDKGVVRDEKVQMARDNVIFELGLCVGCLGMANTFILKPRNFLKFTLPSDLDGINILDYDSTRVDNLDASVAPACRDILKKAKSSARKSKGNNPINQISVKAFQTGDNIMQPPEKDDDSANNDLEENEKKIIKFLGDRGDGYYPVRVLMTLFDGKKTITEHHLDVLKEKGLILTRYTAGVENQHNLSPLGRKYYVKKILEN